MTPTIDQLKTHGRWNPLWDEIAQWDPAWTEDFLRAATAPWNDGVLQAKIVELLCIAGNAACTNLYEPGLRRHIRAALDAGATRDEIVAVLEFVALLGIQSCHLAAPILHEELGGTGTHAALDLLAEWDPRWAVQWSAILATTRNSRALDAKTIELLGIAVNASATHMFEPAVRRHVKAALAAGATREEIVAVLKVASCIGIHAVNVAAPILAAELTADRG